MQYYARFVKIFKTSKTFVIRVDGLHRASLAYFWLSWGSRLRATVKVWKVKLTLEIG
jgi:hypothetical protein